MVPMREEEHMRDTQELVLNRADWEWNDWTLESEERSATT